MPKDYRLMSDDELHVFIQGGAQLGSEVYRGAEQELLRRSVSKLAIASEQVRHEVGNFSRSSRRLSIAMIALTIAIPVSYTHLTLPTTPYV